MDGAGDITEVLLEWDKDRNGTLERVMPVVYAELRKIASSLMRNERPGHTLQPTGLINEAYLRLVKQERVTWKDRSHFFGIAARLMRQILVEHARQKAALKRGGGANVPDGDLSVSADNLEIVLDLDDALNRMAGWDQRKQSVMELHYFGGLKAEEISEALEVSLPTVRRDLVLGRMWLRDHFA